MATAAHLENLSEFLFSEQHDLSSCEALIACTIQEHRNNSLHALRGVLQYISMILLSKQMALLMLTITTSMAQTSSYLQPEPFFPTQASIDFRKCGAHPAFTAPTFPTIAPLKTASPSSSANQPIQCQDGNYTCTQCQDNEYLCICKYHEAVAWYNSKCQPTLWG